MLLSRRRTGCPRHFCGSCFSSLHSHYFLTSATVDLRLQWWHRHCEEDGDAFPAQAQVGDKSPLTVIMSHVEGGRIEIRVSGLLLRMLTGDGMGLSIAIHYNWRLAVLKMAWHSEYL